MDSICRMRSAEERALRRYFCRCDLMCSVVNAMDAGSFSSPPIHALCTCSFSSFSMAVGTECLSPTAWIAINRPGEGGGEGGGGRRGKEREEEKREARKRRRGRGV
jgi:hypothetical protein